ncbi:MAG: C25 family cysteine peptidase, partial [Terriglobales bacterium]
MRSEIEDRHDSARFEQLSRGLLASGHQVRFQARGRSMLPLIRDGETVRVEGVAAALLRVGDIVVARTAHGLRAHRLIFADLARDCFLTRGDAGQESDPPICAGQILGRVVLSTRAHLRARIHLAAQRMVRQGMRWRRILATLATLLFLAAGSTLLRAQVVINDPTTSGFIRPTAAGNFNLTVGHTTAVNPNLLVVVGVSLNTVNTAATVTGVTYAAVPMVRLGFHNDAGNTRRVEIWYLTAPATGIQNAVVTVNLPAAVRVGVVAGVMSFRGVDQTMPLSAMVSNDGAGGNFSQLDIPSGTNQIVFDTLSVNNGIVIAAGPSQTQQWVVNTGATVGDGRGFGSTNVGAASVPMSETFSAATNWSVAGASILPLQADVGVTVNPGGAVPLGNNLTFTITVTNNGPTTATGVSLTDTLAAGLGFVSATPSQGSCAGSGPINCTLGSLAGGASATVTVVASAAASGSYANTATVTATQPDLNTGNNSYTAVGIVQSNTCANPAVLGNGGTLSGVVNTYYPATASVTAGTANTTIPVGTARGAAATIAAGDLLLVMQMQDASINSSNNSNYGNGATGAGFTAINNSGNYEFVKATGPIAGGAIPIAGSGVNSGLIYNYTIAAATGVKGKSTYQVIRVPQYATATLSSTLTALVWDGSSGGVLALDIAGALTLNTATVSVDRLGFRGAAGLQLTGGAGANTDYVHTSPAAYAGAAVAGVDGGKGEGVAGTPLWLEVGNTFFSSGTDGYPNGGMARGAPGDAGGGGTDGNAAANDQNAGGGGGGNGGSGGSGGDSWNSTLGTGGLGGAPFPSTLGRIGLGGGGGGGSRNNSPGDNQASSGAAGGGIIFIRAGSLTGTASLTANGATAYAGTANDAGGGGGAGGTVVVLSAGGGEGGLTIQARGGTGGNAWSSQAFALNQRHGPGGGGGGGVVYLTGAASINVSGGANGTTLNPGVAYGATPGTAGIAVTNAQISQGSGTQSGAGCIPDATITKSHAGSFVRGTSVTYQVVVSNVSQFGATNGAVTMNDTLPVGVVPTSAVGAGWACTVAQQTVSCVRSDALTAGSAYPAITINANVSQNAPGTVANTATVSGGGEINLANDSFTDVAQVSSSADLAMANAGVPNPAAAGANITYTQTVTNSGPSDATSVTLVETIPANTTLQSTTPPAGWACSIPGPTGTLVCSIADMPAATAAIFTVVVRVNPGTPNGTVITDTARVGSAIADPNAANNSATVTTIVGVTAQADLSVTNAASPNPVTPGSNITYAQVVTNTGSAAATTATYSDVVPVNTTFQALAPAAGWTCVTPAVGATGTVSCTNPSVASGSAGNFQLQVRVNPAVPGGTVITDTVTVGAANDANAGNNSATATDLVATAAQADLALSTSSSPSGQVLAGNNLAYTQTIANNGPAATATVTFTEATPANTTFQAVNAPAGWTCITPAVGATGTVTCTNPSLAPGSVANINVTVKVNAATANGTTITANSSVSSTTSDPSAANNTTVVTTLVVAAVDLGVANSGAPSPVNAGNNITYTQTVTNRGPSNAATVSFTQAVPANSTFFSITPPAGWACVTPAVGATGNITCTIATLPPATTANFTVAVRVNPGTPAGTIISDTATVTTTTNDTVDTNNSATVNIAVGGAGQADLRVTNVGVPDPVTAGNNITYTQIATNGGSANALPVIFSGATPANTTFVSLTAPVGWACVTPPPGGTGAISCSIGTLNNGASATFVVVVKVNSNTPFGTLINDTATITSGTPDPNPGNNSASSSIAVGTSADLSITSADSPDPVIAGTNITYTQTLTNPGPSNAANVTFTEAIPANTNFRAFVPPVGWACNSLVVGGTGTLTCTIASLAPGSTNFALIVQVNPGTPSGTTITDTVTVGSSTDTNNANNTAITTTTVATALQADSAMTNTPSAAVVTAGSNVTYTQTVTNNGPATATLLTFSETIPPNTNFQSLTPGSWTCPVLPVGFTGTFNCTLAILILNASAPISLVLQVNANTPSGTVIGDTASVSTGSSTASDPNLANNSATATVTVGTGTSADVAITKTAAPSPVAQGNLLTYTLVVTNNGPTSATNVTVVDVLPTVLKFVSVVTTAGTCSQAANTVTCQLGTIANAATATINIVVTPQSSTIVTNSALVTADQNDPNAANNIATVTTLVTAPTRIHLQALTAEAGAQGVVLRWKTGGELNNLGFNVYREQNGERVRLNPTLVAGSALMMRGYLEKHAGKSYAWIDPAATPTSTYWLEDLDLNGERTMHGPVAVSLTASSAKAASAPTLAEFASLTARPTSTSHIVEDAQRLVAAGNGLEEQQFDLAAHPAVKIMTDHEGWYRVTQPELVAAGLDKNADPGGLRLFVEAIEQPILVTGANAGHGGFGPNAAIEFYATGMDTPFSGTRVYWLTGGDQPGLRISNFNELPSGTNYPQQFTETAELRQRTTYFAALINPNDDNFFGALVSTTPIDQVLDTPHVSATANAVPRIEVVLQGVGEGVPHDVTVALNGLSLGHIAFAGQTKGKMRVDLPPGLLRDTNTVTLTAQDGDSDISLVDHITITYPHSFAADGDRLKFSARAGAPVQITGFSENSIRVFDITALSQPVELATRIVSGGGGSYSAQAQVPWSPAGRHTLLALTTSQIAKPAQLVANQPSQWHSPQAGSQVVVIAHPAFADAVAPLADLHRQQGRTVSVVLTDDIYDEFSFGEHDPRALRDFLQTASKNWTTAPKYLLLAGDASVDPRNFLGFGDFDFVPTRIIPTSQLMTASDDWFSDFNTTGQPALATGRWPVRTADDART